MFSFSTFVLCLLGMAAFFMTAIPTCLGRKRRRIGPRAFQARLATPFALSLGGLSALAITQVPSLQTDLHMYGALLLIVALVSSFAIPFAIICWYFLFLLAAWINIFAAITIIAIAMIIGHIVGYRFAGPGGDRSPPTAPLTFGE